MKRVLVACEYSQIVTSAFRAAGYEAFSCDILPGEVTHSWHIQDDCRKHLDDGWDLLVGHPPCTYLSKVSSIHQWRDKTRVYHTQLARKFFMDLLNAPIPCICIENPIPAKWAYLPTPSQFMDPTEFGETSRKKTALWLRGLPPLLPTHCFNPFAPSHTQECSNHFTVERLGHERARFWPSVAAEMVNQWGPII